MGRKLDVLLGRKFKPSKFKATVNLAVSRAAVLKNQRQARLAVARSDIVQLLNLNHHEHALFRVDQVIKEQNMVDVLVMVDGYCHLVLQMVNLIEKEKDCPNELKEAVSSLLYAAPRCGEFPELQEVREILTARYGKDFAHGAMELRSNCGVNTRMIQKLSPRPSSLETRMKILQEIAAENGVVLKLENLSPAIQQGHVEPTKIATNSGVLDDEAIEELSFSESRKGKKKYRDVEHAAQAAFESAAYAAAAARAAVELSRSRSFGSDNPDSPNSRPRKVLDSNSGKSKLRLEIEEIEEGKTSKDKSVVFDESENNKSENSDFLSPKFDSGNSESGFGEGLEMMREKQVDLTKRPMSVRTRRVYGR
ncbi:hypothetical protein SSX86_007085 [Deinandra increscens subsp. villosa]|uniref:IST1-like protein n=1 Tax=Deinandra increscens subsp. villosa TaxID=3103831 RepID=A0AAP0H7G4_9ASTR